ncbi:MAG TPA: type II toxin-antitoxin system VapC family toxin [Acetobacteraceae bacterium]
MSDFVLDNSVTMRWCFDGGSNDYADDILRQLESQARAAVVPVLWRYEVSAVLARAQVRDLLPAPRAAEFLEDLAALNITVDLDGIQRILAEVHAIAIRYRLTAYDASYLELALRRDLPIATLDAELRDACRTAGVTVL